LLNKQIYFIFIEIIEIFLRQIYAASNFSQFTINR